MTSALASAVALLVSSRLYFSRSPEESTGENCARIGDGLLFASSTPFNRFVLLRCPSIMFQERGDLVDCVHEESYYVNLNNTRILESDSRIEGFEDLVSYQRVCVGTGDGGVISLDWPENLELERERGLDAMVLIVPGTVEGSMDREVKVLVRLALQNGYFPVVMNPRGCGGSPLTTSRFFTAADSDDIFTAVQFVKRSRPWTTLMGIGWGYGASMLTKYLAEVGETTSMTAAVCIDNPFDLDEATRFSRITMSQTLLGGLRDIMQANKVLFQGKTKRFNVAKALSATSIRVFDEAVSMISHGFDVLEDFYMKSSTQQLVGNLKIPVLFIQVDDGKVPVLSTPRSLIAENPFTSLLCSHVPSSLALSDVSIIWYQSLAFEWLSAVELALLKGRHPLLKNMDFNVNPSSGVTLIERGLSGSSFSSKHTVQMTSGFDHKFVKDMHKGDNGRKHLGPPNGNSEMQRFLPSHSFQPSINQDNGLQKGCENTTEREHGQVSRATAVVINAIDVTMPGVLTNEQKNKILTATGQGETLLKALEEAVPEDVRVKLRTAMTEVLHKPNQNLSLEDLKRIGWMPELSSEQKLGMKEVVQRFAHVVDDSRASHLFISTDSGDKALPENLEVSQGKDSPQAHLDETQQGCNDILNRHAEFDRENSAFGDRTVKRGEISQNDVPTMSSVTDHGVFDYSSEINAVEINKSSYENKLDEPYPTNTAEESLSFMSSHLNDDKEAEKQKENILQDTLDQSLQDVSGAEEVLPQKAPPRSPPINVGKALDALTGFDDSTQKAVNSVFEVLENMIDEIEKTNNQDNVENQGENGNQLPVAKLDASLYIDANNDKKVKHDNNRLGEQFDVNRSSNLVKDCLKMKTVTQRCEGISQNQNGFPEDDTYQSLNLSNSGQPLNEAENDFHRDLLNSSTESLGGNGLDGVHSCHLMPSPRKTYSQSHVNVSGFNHLGVQDIDEIRNVTKYSVVVRNELTLPYRKYLDKYLSMGLESLEPSGRNSMTELFIDLNAGQWKMMYQVDNTEYTDDGSLESRYIDGEGFRDRSWSQYYKKWQNVEPGCVIMDANYVDTLQERNSHDVLTVEKLVYSAKKALVERLTVEACRQLGITSAKFMESHLMNDIASVAEAASMAIVYENEMNHNLFTEASDALSVKKVQINGRCVIRAITRVLQDAINLRIVLPVGVIIGASLATLRRFFDVVVLHENVQDNLVHNKLVDIPYNHDFHVEDDKVETADELRDSQHLNKGNLALGASSAAEDYQAHCETILKHAEIIESSRILTQEDLNKLDEATLEKKSDNLVSTLAEKAMAVAAPVVPTKSDGKLDQERLVAILAGIGQKGGFLKIVSKIALLWGGIRGAMSLTDRLISFLHISERPLIQRILSFVLMLLVLWSPVVIPLLPTLVQSWAMKASNSLIEYTCILSLYGALLILVMLWGKRIRGYDNPVEQYGLDIISAPRAFDFSMGFVGGAMMVLFVHFTNAAFGYASFSWPSNLSLSTFGVMLFLILLGDMFLNAARWFVIAFGVALVEELLFRSWLPEEVAVDFGYGWAFTISGLVFALAQRSLYSVPGFLLLSFALFGIKQRANGNLAAPIGLRSGILATTFIVENTGSINYPPNVPLWVVGLRPGNPFYGSLGGLGLCLLLAMHFYPWFQKITRP